MGLQTYLPIEILDYVQTHAPTEEGVYGISQRELARALGYHPCSMSRPLYQLVTEGLLAARRAPVRDGKRKQLTYRLTPVGAARLKRETGEVPLLSGEIPPPPHPFLGRREELDRLAQIGGAGASVTFVDGPAGMGKTSLVSRHLRRIKRGRVPFWFTVRSTTSPRQFGSALSHALSYLGNPQLTYYCQLPRTPIAKEVADLAARTLANRDLAAVVDDVQLASRDMRRFLSEMISSLGRRGDHQFYIVGQEPEPFEAPGVPSYQLSVGGLDRAAAHELTDRQGGLAERFEAVYQSTLGSPLLLKLAVSNPDIKADAAALPAAVVKSLTQDEARRVLPAALANEPLPLTFIGEEGGLTPERLQELVRMGLLQSPLKDRVEVLQVVRAALLGRVHPTDERAAHARLARFYGRSHRPEAIRERLLHLIGAEDWKAASRLLDDQQRVVLRLGYSETLRTALRHLSTALPRGPAKVRVLFSEASLLRHHSDYAEAITSLRRAITEAAGDPRLTCEAHLAIVDLQVRLAQVMQAEAEFESARRIGAVSRRLEAYFVLSLARLEQGRGTTLAAGADYQRAFELARKARANDLALESIVAWSSLAEPSSGPPVALKVVEEALPNAREAGRMDIVFNLLLVRARAYSDLGQQELAAREMETMRGEAEALGYLTQLTRTLSGLAAVAIQRGQWAEAGAYAKQASAMAERLGDDLVLGHTLALHCTSEFRQVDQGGDPRLLDEALGHGNRSVEILSRLAPSDSLILAHAYLTEVHLYKRETREAKDHYDQAIAIANELGLGWLRDQLIKEPGAQVQEALSKSKVESSRPSAEGLGETGQA
jgi:tetratricopeptide (TPR) repeat protein/DNA-binding MarR family transcriptional regulator